MSADTIGPVHERGMFNIERFDGHCWHGGMNRGTCDNAIKTVKVWAADTGDRYRVFSPEGQLVFNTDTALPVSGPVDVLAARVIGMTPGMSRVEVQLPRAGIPAWADLGCTVTIANPAAVAELKNELEFIRDGLRCEVRAREGRGSRPEGSQSVEDMVAQELHAEYMLQLAGFADDIDAALANIGSAS